LGKAWAKRLKPRNLEHLSALVALLRPGTLHARDERGVSMTELYCRRKNGEEPVEIDIQAIEHILAPTYDVMCIDQDANISLVDGRQVPLHALRPGDMLHSLNPETLQAEFDTCESVGPTRREDGVKVTLENGFSLITTRDHEYLTFYGFKEAQDLDKETDLVAVLHSPPRTFQAAEDNWLGNAEDVAYFMGYAVGNGSLTKSTTLCTGTEERADRLIQWLSRRLPLLCCRKYFHTRSWYIAISYGGLINTAKYGNRKTRFRVFLEENQLNRTCKEKVIPECVLAAAPPVQFAFLAGLFDADGCGRKTCAISSSSPYVLESLRHLGTIYGFCPHIGPSRKSIIFFNARRFAQCTVPYRLLRNIVRFDTRGVQYGRVPRHVIKEAWLSSGMSQREFARLHKMQTVTFASERRANIPVEHGTAIKCGVDTNNVRFMRIRKIEVVRDHQFYGLSVRKNHNLIANGVCVHNCYQEQSMQIAQVVAGFNPVEVDKLRKAAGKKDQKLMTEVGVMFVERATNLGVITKEEAERLFANIQKSGRYQFNKSHSVCYAIDSYYTAHQKAHIPIYFFTAYLRYAKEKQDPLKEIRALINDAKTFNIEVQPPRFQDLDPHFSTDRVVITFGLSDVKGIGVKNVAKTLAAIGGVEQERGKSSMEWTWFEFLVYFSEHSNAAMVKKMIEVGALRNFKLDRLCLLAEYDAWLRLTKTEREKVAALPEPLIKMSAVKELVEVEVDDYDDDEMDAYNKACKEAPIVDQDEDGGPLYDLPEHPKPIGKKLVKRHRNKKNGDGTSIYEPVLDENDEPIVLDDGRVVTNLIEALGQLLERPGAVTKGRRDKVEAIRDLLLHPPTPLEDKPYWIAKKEEEALGLPITFTHVDAADKSMVDTTCKELREGKDVYEMTIGVEIQEVREIVIKNGNNRGHKMAYLCVSDETGALDDVTIFSEAWEEYGYLLARDKMVAALQGRKDQKRGSFIVDKVWEI
jgi:hypothetical protein